MRLAYSVSLWIAILANAPTASAFTYSTYKTPGRTTTTLRVVAATENLSQDGISKLRFRELKQELLHRDLPAEGTTAQLRNRLREAMGIQTEECIVNEDDMGDDCVDPALDRISVQFIDQSDPAKTLKREIYEKSEKGYWKAATRKLKTMTRKYSDQLERGVYLTVLEACMANRLQGARASEPVRKILEQMMEDGHDIPETAGNYCIKNCLGDYGNGHEGFGGVDTALAMLYTLEATNTKVQSDTYDRVMEALAHEGSVDDAMTMLRKVVVEKSETPPLSTFATIAKASISNELLPQDKVLNLLALAKAAGYELDNIANTQDGREIIACGVIAAERLNNTALGLRLLTAAAKANVEPDRGDIIVASSSSAAQRACTLIHKQAIIGAAENGDWKLSVKLLELMLERGLRPSGWIWRNVVTCCAKAEKSRKATGLLLDWVKLYESNKADQPPLSVFNTVVNVCEICNEQELTLQVLDTMEKTHDTEGNLITINIALKRLAKQGNFQACEGIIVGMLQAGVEPSVVSYTTAIASCVQEDNKQPAMAYEWLKRMRIRDVMPNVLTYNTAFAACLDGKLDSTFLGSKIAQEMLDDVDAQLAKGDDDLDEFTNVVPDSTTKYMARQLMQQLQKNWKEGTIEKRVATETVRIPLLKLVDFQKTEAAEQARIRLAGKSKARDEDQATATTKAEIDLEYEAASSAHRTAEV